MFKSEAKEKGFGFGLCFSKLSEKLSKSSSGDFSPKSSKNLPIFSKLSIHLSYSK